MRVDRPPPGENLNEGAVANAREAASVIVLRDGAGDAGAGIEVLLVQRNPAASFMGGAWVFPGGSVQAADDGPEGAGRRELEEEAGVRLAGAKALTPFSRWITPAEVKTRFDTWFYLAEEPAGAAPRCDGSECVDLRWIAPAAALEAHARDELMLVFPTIKTLEQLAESPSVAEALDAARAREIVAILPRVVVRDGSAHVLLPGEPGYDA